MKKRKVDGSSREREGRGRQSDKILLIRMFIEHVSFP